MQQYGMHCTIERKLLLVWEHLMSVAGVCMIQRTFSYSLCSVSHNKRLFVALGEGGGRVRFCPVLRTASYSTGSVLPGRFCRLADL